VGGQNLFFYSEFTRYISPFKVKNQSNMPINKFV
jgi:hypothetical protein